MYNPFSTKKEFDTLNTAFNADGPIQQNPHAAAAFNTLVNKALVRTVIVTGVVVAGVVALSYVLNEQTTDEEPEDPEFI